MIDARRSPQLAAALVAVCIAAVALSGCGRTSGPQARGASADEIRDPRSGAGVTTAAGDQDSGGSYCVALLNAGIAKRLHDIAAAMPPNLPAAEAEQIAASLERISGVATLTDTRAKDNAVRFAIVTASWALRSALDNQSTPGLIPTSAGLAVSASYPSLADACQRAGVPLP